MPARYILRFSFCVKFSSGELGKILPPPRQSGLLARPARARPVPFCAQGLRVDAERGLLLVKGSVPGADGGHIIVRPSVKTPKKKGA